MWTDFKNSFTRKLRRIFTVKQSLEIQPHLKRVTGLPREIQAFKICTDQIYPQAVSGRVSRVLYPTRHRNRSIRRRRHTSEDNVAMVNELIGINY